MRDNIISFNYLKSNHEKEYEKKKFNGNKEENVNNINIFPAKKKIRFHQKRILKKIVQRKWKKKELII